MPFDEDHVLRRALLVLIVALSLTLAACSRAEEAGVARGGADEATDHPDETITIGATAVPNAVNPTASSSPTPQLGAHTDCANAWVSYIDPDGRYSLCHPPDLTVRTVFVLGNRNVVIFDPGSPESRRFPAIGFEWRPQSQRTPGSCVGPSDPSPYATDRTTDVVVAGRSLPICFTHAYTDEAKMHLGYAGLYFEYPVSDGGAVSIQSVWHDPDVEAKQEAIMRILNTLRVR